MKRWIAIVERKQRLGYALDYYPEEKAAHYAEYKKHIIGDFASRKEAEAAVDAAMKKL